MFLAIINDTYTEVKEELSSQTNELQITDIIKQVKIRLTREFSERYTHTHTHLLLSTELREDHYKA